MKEIVVRELICDKCGGNSFTLQIKYKKEDEMSLLFCHDGFGFQFEDAIWICNKCKKESIENLKWELKKQ